MNGGGGGGGLPINPKTLNPKTPNPQMVFGVAHRAGPEVKGPGFWVQGLGV